jgi:hypothetical protein
MEDVAIWWLDQQSCEMAFAFGAADAGLPDYIVRELESRAGRPGNGRLWIAPEIEFNGMEWGDGPSFNIISERCGGIVVRMADLRHILGWPGIVTGIHLKPIVIESVSLKQ